MALTLRQLQAGLPEGLGREEASTWLREANQSVEAAVGLIATPEQMKSMSSDEWHVLQDDPYLVSDLVRAAHQAFKARYPSR